MLDLHIKLTTSNIDVSDSQFQDARYILKNLRNLPSGEGLQLLMKYKVDNMDIAKIAALSKESMRGLKEDLKTRKAKYNGLIAYEEKEECFDDLYEIEGE